MSTRRSQILYALLDPRVEGPFKYGTWVFPYQPFYIGVGKPHRPKLHFSPSNLTRKNHKVHTIKAIIRETGQNPLIQVKKTGLTNRESLDLEQKLIRLIGRRINGGPLTNATDGGDGGVNRVVSKSERKAHSEYWATLSISERKRIAARLSEVAKRREASLTDKDRKAISQRISEGVRKAIAKRTPQHKAKHYAKVSQAHRNRWANMTESDYKKACMQAKLRSQTRYVDPEVELERRRKISIAATKYWKQVKAANSK